MPTPANLVYVQFYVEGDGVNVDGYSFEGVYSSAENAIAARKPDRGPYVVQEANLAV